MSPAAGAGPAREPEPRELLALADLLLTEPPDSMAGRWPRAVAILVRQALELSMDRLWLRVAPGLGHASFRAQLLCLPAFVHGSVASSASVAWSELSRACHHHAYELPPTAEELAGWLETTERLRAVVEATGARGATA